MTTVTPPAYVIESEEQYAKGYDPRVVARLIEYIHPYRWRLLLGIFLMILGSAVAVAGPWIRVCLPATWLCCAIP
jgi:hypothetical protein